MMPKRNVLAISGSTKANSTNEPILRAIVKLHPQSLNFEIYPGIADLPHFNPDLDKAPRSVKELRSLIESADGVLERSVQRSMRVQN